MRRWAGWGLGGSFIVVTGWLCWDNVFSDVEPIKRLAEEAACKVKKCADQHGMSRMERTPFGQSFTYTWIDASVPVSCRREYFLAGARRCSTN